MFTALKLRTKLLFGFGTASLMLLVVTGIYQYANTTSVQDFHNLMAEELAISAHAEKAENAMLQCRRNEKDFLLRLDVKYKDTFLKNLEQVNSHAQAIVPLARVIGQPDLAGKAQSIERSATEYEAAFLELVAAWDKRGLDHNSGRRSRTEKSSSAAAAFSPQLINV